MAATQAGITDVRLAEFMAALSIATDLAMGQPLEQALCSCVLAVRLGEELGLGEEELRGVYYQALLRYIGCNAETHEEVGIPPYAVLPIGALPPVATVVTSMLIHPFVGQLAGTPELRPDPFEVAETIEVPLAVLLDPATYHEEDWVIRGVQRRIFVYRHGPYDIWGATGRIVQQFLRRLRAWPDRPAGYDWTLDEVAAALAATAGRD